MDTTRRTGRRQTALAPRWRRTARAVFNWWWNLDRRRRSGQLAGHPLDEALVVEAMARQLEEIRHLPEPAS